MAADRDVDLELGELDFSDDPNVIKMVKEDVKRILAGKRYPPRGESEEFRVPEDISTQIALQIYGVDAYDVDPLPTRGGEQSSEGPYHMGVQDGGFNESSQEDSLNLPSLEDGEYDNLGEDNIGEDSLGENDVVMKDVEAIIHGKRYPPRGTSEELRIPEDISTKIALEDFGIDAYHQDPHQSAHEGSNSNSASDEFWDEIWDEVW